MIEAVLFDLDGTIINTNHLVLESFKHTIQQHLGYIPEHEKLVGCFGEPLKTSLARFDAQHVEELCNTYKAFNEKMHDSLAKEIEDAEETLIHLKHKGIQIGVVTSKRRVMAERGLTLFSLKKWIDVLVTPEDTAEHKPNAAPALKACDILGVSPKNALFVGDSHFDILCGKNAGAQTCLVKYTALCLDKLMEYNPDYVVSSLKELLDIIEESKNIKVSNI